MCVGLWVCDAHSHPTAQLVLQVCPVPPWCGLVAFVDAIGVQGAVNSHVPSPPPRAAPDHNSPRHKPAPTPEVPASVARQRHVPAGRAPPARPSACPLCRQRAALGLVPFVPRPAGSTCRWSSSLPTTSGARRWRRCCCWGRGPRPPRSWATDARRRRDDGGHADDVVIADDVAQPCLGPDLEQESGGGACAS